MLLAMFALDGLLCLLALCCYFTSEMCATLAASQRKAPAPRLVRRYMSAMWALRSIATGCIVVLVIATLAFVTLPK